jgi:hypothetical protein
MDTKYGSSIKTCTECQLNNLIANASAVQNTKSIEEATKVIRMVVGQRSSKAGCDVKAERTLRRRRTHGRAWAGQGDAAQETLRDTLRAHIEK